MQSSGRSFKAWWLVAAIVVIAAVGAMIGGGDRDDVSPSSQWTTLVMGDPDAPIHVIEYSDFQCPFCGIFARNIRPRLIEEFVDTGKIRFEWRNYPVFGPFSTLAAHGAMCAVEQGAFWPYHDALFARIDEMKASEKNLDTLVKIASSIGLDAREFRACMVEDRYAEDVAATLREGRERGVMGTPTFIINGVMMVGAQPVETWRQVVEALTGGS